MSNNNQVSQMGMSSIQKRQSGVVLVMALVMLTLLTLIGVSSMNSSTLEMRVASNMQQHNIAFQAAQSRLAFAGTDDVANPVDYLIAPIAGVIPDQTCNPGPPDNCPDAEDALGEKLWLATATVEYIDCGKGLGSSLESGKGFSYRIFEIKASGETVTGSAKSVQASAIRYPVKGCGDEML